MKSKFSIFTQIWVPYTVTIAVLFLVLSLYYPSKQKSLLTEYKISELKQQASSLALSVETGLEGDNMNSLEKTMHRFQTESKLKCISYVFTDSSGDIVNTIPQGVNHFDILKDSSHYTTVKTNFKTDLFSGYVMISSDNRSLKYDIDKMNAPIIWFLLISSIIVILIVYCLARLITEPINQVKKYAYELEIGNYDLTANKSWWRAKELHELQKSLIKLSRTLKIQKNDNQKLTEGLEDEIRIRTKEIVKKNTYLEHAAKIIRHDMHSGINTYIPRGLKGIERKMTEVDQKSYKIDTSVKMIKEGLTHTQKVYKGVYEFTNLVKKDAILEKTDCDIKKILSEYLSATAYKNQIIMGDLGHCKVNESLFCTAIDNLIRNGLKYNDSPKKEVKISRNNDILFIEDNGRGMSSEDFIFLSQPYTRKEGQDESGSGLGLNICLSIMEEHGFHMDCDKIPGGTKIQIKL
jgi:signal transduction histidine kinase